MNKSKTVLVVDDDTVYLTVTAKALKSYYNVAAAKSGNQALQYLENNTCDLILLDYEMSGMDGTSVFLQLRSDPKTASIPVIFLTGNNDSQTVMQVLSMKPEGYIVKPIGAEELLKRIESIIG